MTSKETRPLVIRCDGALLSTNLMLELFWAALAASFYLTVSAIFTLAWHPARLKNALNRIATLDVALLPVRAEGLALARGAEMAGRPVVLVSPADQNLVSAVALHFGFAGPHFGSTASRNLCKSEITARLNEAFGAGGFEVVTPPKPGFFLAGFRQFLKEIRPYQWVKNLLLLLPLLAAHDAAFEDILKVLLAMVAFSFGASSIYILNDLLDLDADRRHPEKRHRPIAAGALPISAAMLGSLASGILAVSLGAITSWAVAGLIAAYMSISLVYSLQLKSMRWVDLFVLASLFTLRVLTGGAASGTGLSAWLGVFVFAVFFTLADVKRLTALARAPKGARLPGRGYTHADMAGLRHIAIAAVLVALSAFAGYTFSAEADVLYTNPTLLRLVSIPMAIWLARMIYLSQRGEEDYDPIVFVAHDRLGHLVIAIGVLLTYLAI